MLRLLVIVCISMAGSRAANAHHSLDAFNVDELRTIAGTVRRFDWTFPHTRTEIEARDEAGNATVWRFEGMSPDYLGRRGWNRRTLEAGDAVEVVYFPRRDGAPGGMLVRVTLGDGTVRVMVDPE